MSWRSRLSLQISDAAVASVGVLLSAMAVWGQPFEIGTEVAGPSWLRAVFPLLLGAPLAWRRTAPLPALALVMAGLVLHAVVTRDSPEGLEILYCLGVATYSAAAHSTRRAASVGLAVALVGYGVYAAADQNIRSGRPSELWAGAFFGLALIATWLAGVFVRERREVARAAARADTAALEAQTAVADERARLARELHDVVSHNLSVVVVQAAGARASGSADPETLEKIERSGRDSLLEMRRLLGVLRSSDDDPTLAPNPGAADLPALAETMRLAGLPVELDLQDTCRELPAAVDLSVYRIVQEALTNTLRHAGPARVTVTVRCASDDVLVTVADDGRGPSGSDGGHGLIGMAERVSLFGGELKVGAGPGGRGFVVRARLPPQGHTP
jgi:signal transduction histidine kinase